MAITKQNYTYVCAPPTIKIVAKDSSTNARLDVVLYVSDKEALFGSYTIREYKQDEANDRVKIFCTAITMFTEDEIQDYVEADRIMPALYAYRNLQKVWTKSGGLIWQR